MRSSKLEQENKSAKVYASPVEDALETYRAKRDFETTAEPEGTQSDAHGIYVVQKHDARRLHYDFRLEHNGVLLSWAVPKEPSKDKTIKRLAVHVEDHPVDYANFQGTIPAGNYGAGTVEIWDRGTWQPLSDVDAAMSAGKLEFLLFGERLRGTWVLVRLDGETEDRNWLLFKAKDKGEVRVEVGHWRKDTALVHQLCEMRTALPSGPEWTYEVKWDGYRAFVVREQQTVSILTRTGNRLNLANLETGLLEVRPQDFVLDGELVVTDSEGKSDFGMLQKALRSEPDVIRFVAFDILRLGDSDLRSAPLYFRRSVLLKNFREDASQALIVSPELPGDAESLQQSICEIGLEGVIAKRKDSIYSGRRSSDWVKVKCRRTDIAWVIGFTDLAGEAEAIGALVLAKSEGEVLKYIGRVGTGFSHSERVAIKRTLEPFIARRPPIAQLSAMQRKGVTWVEPTVTVKVEFAELTGEGVLRQASYKGIRKTASTRKPTTAKTAVKLTSPDRVVDEQTGSTKQDVFDYYHSIADWLVPEIEDRFVSILRCPEGVSGESFFQKHLMGGKYKSLSEVEDGDTQFVTAPDSIAVLEAVQMSAMEFQAQATSIKRILQP